MATGVLESQLANLRTVKAWLMRKIVTTTNEGSVRALLRLNDDLNENLVREEGRIQAQVCCVCSCVCSCVCVRVCGVGGGGRLGYEAASVHVAKVVRVSHLLVSGLCIFRQQRWCSLATILCSLRRGVLSAPPYPSLLYILS
jgi:hypothetical protein